MSALSRYYPNHYTSNSVDWRKSQVFLPIGSSSWPWRKKLPLFQPLNIWKNAPNVEPDEFDRL